MPIDALLPQQMSAEVHTDEHGDAYRICYRDNDDSEDGALDLEWRFYFNGRSVDRR